MERGYEVYEFSRRGDLAQLREALQQGNTPDTYQAYDGSTALVMAARSGHGHIVKELLAAGADREVRTDDGSTVLHHAVSGGSAEAVAAILKAGSDANEANEDGVTPLILAAHYGHADVARLLCDKGADVHWEAQGWGTALDCAEGAVAEMLESLGARRSEGGGDQPMASGAERFHYGCFESGMNPSVALNTAPQVATKQAATPTLKPRIGDSVRLKQPKPGLLKEGDVGKVVNDDGSDCCPLKVQLGEAYDYYEYHDVVVHVDLPPDSDRATPEGTLRVLTSKLHTSVPPRELGSSGLHVSPIGFGCHRLSNSTEARDALSMALNLGCNLVDLASNYTDGDAESTVGDVLAELIGKGMVRRDEIIVATKVGNILGKQLPLAAGVASVSRLSDDLSHCISPEWIEQEITRSLKRLKLKCLDCVLLHCPEVEAKVVGMSEVYSRMGAAFKHLQAEVARGRIAMYGVSAAFFPLRPTDPKHLDLQAVLAQLPAEHSFRVVQTPLNFAEAQLRWVGHVERHSDGRAFDSAAAADAPTFFELVQKHSLAVLTNRPLDGIYKESHGVLRFSSLDCDVRSFSELQLDNCDALEDKLTAICKLTEAPYGLSGENGKLAAKTIKVISSLPGVTCVLLGMRRPEYVVDALPLTFGTPPLRGELAEQAVRAMHNTVEMWFATAIHEADHGTSKQWRLPVAEKYTGVEIGA